VRKLIHDKPWLVVVFALLFFLGLMVAFLAIALLNPPDLT